MYFLQYAPHSDFEQGIFMPFNSQSEAERQAAADLVYAGVDDFLIGLFEAEYGGLSPQEKWGAMRNTPDVYRKSGHLDPDNRHHILDLKGLKKIANKRVEELEAEKAQGIVDHLLAINKAIREGTEFEAAVPGNAYTWCTGGTATAGACALAAATAKTAVLALSASANQFAITEIGVSFDGVTASNVPVLVELISGTAGTAGTPRSALAAAKQLRGWPAQTSQTTCADTYTAEPGTALVNRKWLISPNGGLWVEQYPLGREPTGVVTSATDAKTWAIRCTAPAVVNVHAYLEFEE